MKRCCFDFIASTELSHAGPHTTDKQPFSRLLIIYTQRATPNYLTTPHVIRAYDERWTQCTVMKSTQENYKQETVTKPTKQWEEHRNECNVEGKMYTVANWFEQSQNSMDFVECAAVIYTQCSVLELMLKMAWVAFAVHLSLRFQMMARQ